MTALPPRNDGAIGASVPNGEQSAIQCGCAVCVMSARYAPRQAPLRDEVSQLKGLEGVPSIMSFR